MPSTEEMAAVFQRLRELLAVHAPRLVVRTDNEQTYYLDTAHIMKNKAPLFFGSVQIKKSYVSYHLMPVYVFPDLLEGTSPELRRRMQGKSCFNFTRVDEPLMAELAGLTRAGFERFEREGLLQ